MAFKLKLNPNLEKILSVPYPFDVVEQNKAKAVQKFGADYLIDFGVGDPVDPTPEIVRAAMKKAVDERKSAGYPSTIGMKEYREAVSGWMKKRFNVSMPADNIVGSYGAKDAVSRLIFCLIDPAAGDYGIAPNPGYPPYSEGTIYAGGKMHYLNLLPENNFELDLAKIPPRVQKSAKIFFLNSPQSPTGKICSLEKTKEIVDYCNDNNIVLVSDECYSEIYFKEKPHSVFEVKGAEECAVSINSFSKRSRMTCYAVGFAATFNTRLLKAFRAVQQKTQQGIPTFIQDACIAALEDEAHVTEMIDVYEKRMGTLIPALNDTGFSASKPDGTFYIWAKVPKGKTPLETSEWLLLEKGINCTPGNLISNEFEGVNPGKEFVRFAMVPTLEKTVEAAERLGK